MDSFLTHLLNGHSILTKMSSTVYSSFRMIKSLLMPHILSMLMRLCSLEAAFNAWWLRFAFGLSKYRLSIWIQKLKSCDLLKYLQFRSCTFFQKLLIAKQSQYLNSIHSFGSSSRADSNLIITPHSSSSLNLCMESLLINQLPIKIKNLFNYVWCKKNTTQKLIQIMFTQIVC